VAQFTTAGIAVPHHVIFGSDLALAGEGFRREVRR
jgi:hypothetical protein